MPIDDSITVFQAPSAPQAAGPSEQAPAGSGLGSVGLPGRWALAGRIIVHDPAADVAEGILDIAARCTAREPAEPRLGHSLAG